MRPCCLPQQEKARRLLLFGLFCCYYGLFLIVSRCDMYKTINEPAKQMPDELTHNCRNDLNDYDVHAYSPPSAMERTSTAYSVYHNTRDNSINFKKKRYLFHK